MELHTKGTSQDHAVVKLLTREVVREIREILRRGLDPADYARLSEAVFKGNASVAELLRAQQALSARAKDGRPPGFDEAVKKVMRSARQGPDGPG